MKTYGLALTLLAILFVMPAHAQGIMTVTQTDTYTSADSAILGFSDFDGSLGSLESVEVEISNTAFTEDGTLVDTLGTRTYTITPDDAFGLSYTLGGTSFLSTSTVTGSTTMTTLSTGGTYVVPTTSGTATGNSLTYTDAPTLASYTGTGLSTVDLYLQATDDAAVSGNHYALNLSSMGTGSVSLVYTYSAVPEPGQTAVWILGLGLCLVAGRKFIRRPVLA